MHILDISRDFTLKSDGGSVVTKRNFNLLSSLGKTDSLFIPIPTLRTRIINYVLRQSYGETPELTKNLKRFLGNSYDFIFFDGSIYGGYLKNVSFAGFKTICFFHNVEKVYYQAKAKHTNSLMDKMIIPFIIHNEKLSVEHADYLITLNLRDSEELAIQYGRKADLILPSSFPSINLQKTTDDTSPYLLFVGTNFFANIEGVQFIIDKIAPNISMPIKIVGNVDESFKNASLPSNVEMLGRVENIETYYCNASAVIAPIFAGSGLKTKTVEALRYGKTILGTTEAFEGIDISSNPLIGKVCNNAEEYVKAINSLSIEKFNTASFSLFNKNYSDSAALLTLRNFLCEINL